MSLSPAVSMAPTPFCHRACARGLNHQLHSTALRHGHPAVTLTPTSSAAQHLAGLPPSARETTVRYHRESSQPMSP